MERGAAHDITGIEQPTAQSGDSRTQDSAPARDSRTASPSPGLEFPRCLYVARRRPVRRGHVGAAIGRHRQRARRSGVRAARRRDSVLLVAAGDQHRRLEVFPRPNRHARPREQRQAADRPRGQHDYRVGAQGRLLRLGERSSKLQRRAEAHPGLPEGRLQQPGMVQLRL